MLDVAMLHLYMSTCLDLPEMPSDGLPLVHFLWSLMACVFFLVANLNLDPWNIQSLGNLLA